MARYAENAGLRPPIELMYGLQAERFGGLPSPGGLRDQPAGLMIRMTAAVNIYTAWKLWKGREGGKEADFKKRHPGEFRMAQRIQKLMDGANERGSL